MKAFVVVSLSLLLASSARGDSSVIVDDMGFDLSTTYFWRGYEIVDHPVLQPAATATFGNSPLSLAFWGSFVLGDHNNHEATDELDLTLSAAHDFAIGERSFSLEAGSILYTFPEAPKGTRRSAEVFASLSPDAVLAPTLSYFYDFDAWDASYLSLALAPEISMRGESSLTIAPSVGFGDTDQAFGFQDFTVTASTTSTWNSIEWTPTFGVTRAARAVNAEKGGVWGMLSLRFPR